MPQLSWRWLARIVCSTLAGVLLLAVVSPAHALWFYRAGSSSSTQNDNPYTVTFLDPAPGTYSPDTWSLDLVDEFGNPVEIGDPNADRLILTGTDVPAQSIGVQFGDSSCSDDDVLSCFAVDYPVDVYIEFGTLEYSETGNNGNAAQSYEAFTTANGTITYVGTETLTLDGGEVSPGETRGIFACEGEEAGGSECDGLPLFIVELLPAPGNSSLPAQSNGQGAGSTTIFAPPPSVMVADNGDTRPELGIDLLMGLDGQTWCAYTPSFTDPPPGPGQLGCGTITAFLSSEGNQFPSDLPGTISLGHDRFPLAAIPEPTTLALLGAGLLGLGWARRRRSTNT